VDSFFFMSGFLLAFLLLSRLDTANTTSTSSTSSTSSTLKPPATAAEHALLLLKLYAQRWLRITPAFMAAVLFYWQLLPLLSSGPYWDSFDGDCAICKRYWWTNPLYINNLVPFHASLLGLCWPVGWYLSNDMQFFVLSAPLLLLYRKRPKLVCAVLGCALAASCGYSLWLALAQGIKFTIFDG
jgi:peptidoglycan/LPS O-acetylase OafA/YrhL